MNPLAGRDLPWRSTLDRAALIALAAPWLLLLQSPTVTSGPLGDRAILLGLLLVLLGAALGPLWSRLPGSPRALALAGADLFAGRRWIPSLLVYLGVRLPLLLEPSFGRDPDCWRVVNTARLLWEDGVYRSSRPPGYPVPEIALSPLIVFGGAVAAKFAVALVGFAALYAFDRLGRALGARAMGLATVVLAMAPQFIVQTTVVMDYVVALAALLFALLSVARSGPARGGLWIGVGFASRITTAIYGLPLLLLARARGASAGVLARMSVLGALSGAVLFGPVLATQGASFLRHADVQPTPDQAALAAMGALGYWPLVCAGLLLGDRLREGRAEVGWLERASLGLAVALGVGLFAWLPLDAGYLLPPMVLLLLLAACTCRPATLAMLGLAGLLSVAQDQSRGSVAFEMAQRRAAGERYEALRRIEVDRGAVVVLTGGELALLTALGTDLEAMNAHGPWRSARRDPVTDVRYLARLNGPLHARARAEGRSVYLSDPRLDSALEDDLGYSLVDRGAVVLGRSARRSSR